MKARAPNIIAALGAAGLVGALVLLISDRSLPQALPATISGVLFGFGLAASGIIGWVILRRTGNPIGWIFLVVGTAGTLWSASGEYLVHSFGVARLPTTTLVAVLANFLGGAMVMPLALVCLLFPTGRPPSPRWRWVTRAWMLAAACAFLWTVGRAGEIWSEPDRVRGRVISPFSWPAGVESALITLMVSLGLGAGLAGVVSLVLRTRRATGEERQQIRWLTLVAAAVATSLVLLLGSTLVLSPFGIHPAWLHTVGNIVFGVVVFLIVIGMPVAVAIGILKYRLYDLDVVIRKTVVFGLLAVFITAVYAFVVGGVGALLSSIGSTTLSFAAAAALAVLFQPARDRARKLADRLVYGKRATPYEVLAEFSGRMSETYASDDVLPRMATVLGEGTGAESAVVWLQIGTEMRAAAVQPPGTSGPGHVPEDAAEVRHQGELLGALSVVMPPADPMNPAKDKLVRDLAAQAGLVLRNVRLIEELRASRQRLVAAQDEERRKIERNLHDGAQQQLVALQVKLRLAEGLLGRDAAEGKNAIAGLQTDTNEALENLRDLARGIYPPLLADKGIAAAVEAQARRSTVPTSVEAGDLSRYAPEVEATIYFCTLEALQNVAKYAGATRTLIRLFREDGLVTFEIEDDGAGFDTGTTGYGTGLRGMADRLDAVGGSLDIRSAPGRGTTIVGRVPVRVGVTAG